MEVDRISVSEMMRRALEHLRAGRLDPSDTICREVLQHVPDHPDALHLLAVSAHQSGRSDAAIELDMRAICADPSHPGYHTHLGLVLEHLGRPSEAIASHRKALALRPESPHAHFNLGNALRVFGRRAEAIDSFRATLALKADFPEAHNNLGTTLQEEGEIGLAVASYLCALRLRPTYVDALYNLGNSLRELGRLDEAIASYNDALALAPTHARANNNLGLALMATGKTALALTFFRRALAISEPPDFKASIAQCLAYCNFDASDRALRSLVARALSEGWARPTDLAGAAIRLVRHDPVLGPAIQKTLDAWPYAPIRGSAELAIAANLRDDGVLRALMETTPVSDVGLERFLTHERRALLERTLEADIAGTSSAEMLAFYCALARQCFINDYVFWHTEEELKRAQSLCERVTGALATGATISPAWLAAAAAYWPLGSLPMAQTLLNRSWPQPVSGLLLQQIVEPSEEMSAQESLSTITPVRDGVSQTVRRQYEENPYPKWTKAPSTALLDAPLRGAYAQPKGGGLYGGTDLDILVAGCGTGQESIDMARRFPHSHVLAIDLSRASLAYATRKARELGVTNVEHAQADILELGLLGRDFDLVSCVGVLHHLRDPMTGWRNVTMLLRPGGLMLVGLYSQVGRADVVRARRFIDEHGYASTSDDIRRCRQDLLESGDFADITKRTDFYAISECRDLLFHSQEQCFSLPRISEAIAALGLEFVGLSVDPAIARSFCSRSPHDAEMTDLQAWDAFEKEFPATFSGMYVFWVRKPDAA